MPKGAKKAGARNGRNSEHQTGKTDFTLYEFAHAEVGAVVSGAGRMRKAVANGWSTEAKQLCGPNTKTEASSKTSVTESLAWYEKDLSDFDLEDNEDNTDELNNNTETGAQDQESDEATTNTPRREKRPGGRWSSGSTAGRTYPLDLWYLLGDHVLPGDVATFAMLCQGSHQVVHSAGFWLRLYRRHYRSSVELPRHLRPESIQRIHGIRPRVIASLFYTYQPFVVRTQTLAPMESDPDILIGARCNVIWYNRVKNLWHFFFKFRRPCRRRCSLALAPTDLDSRPRDLLKADDIDFNREDNCCVLKVVLQNFVSLPPVVMGQVLAKTFVSVGHRMRFHKVKLVFSSEYVDSNNRNAMASGTTVVLDPVLNIHVMHWWNPKYPDHRS